MKRVFLAVLLLVGVQMSVMAGPGHDHGKDHRPMHGGLFHQAAHDYELVIKDGEVRLYVTDHGNVVNLGRGRAGYFIHCCRKQRCDSRQSRSWRLFLHRVR